MTKDEMLAGLRDDTEFVEALVGAFALSFLQAVGAPQADAEQVSARLAAFARDEGEAALREAALAPRSTPIEQ